jgi:hypothetical protein
VITWWFELGRAMHDQRLRLERAGTAGEARHPDQDAAFAEPDPDASDVR